MEQISEELKEGIARLATYLMHNDNIIYGVIRPEDVKYVIQAMLLLEERIKEKNNAVQCEP